MSRAKFGPGGNGDLFYAQGGKETVQAPAWLKEYGLDAYEFEAGNGIAAGEATLRKIGEEARKYNISMSLHTPYYISLSGVDPEKRLKSIDYISCKLSAGDFLHDLHDAFKILFRGMSDFHSPLLFFTVGSTQK